MKKTLSSVLLLLFVSFQTFQLWDETGDAVASAGSVSQVVSQRGAEWTAVPVPYDDADASFPLVIGQSLIHGALLQGGSAEYSGESLVVHFSVADSVIAFINDRSPPHPRIAENSFTIASLILDRSPARTLAPPLA